jgi:catechol 2,3-dioxygenase-like lactoylglutathione lyase family enzyme
VATVARAVGINHVALEVGDLAAALEFYGRIFEVRLRGRGRGMAFIDMGDWEIQLTKAPEVLAGMGLAGLGKTEGAMEELRAKGLTGDP